MVLDMDKLTLLERACRAAYEAETWATTNPGLAAIRRRDALALTAMARAIVQAEKSRRTPLEAGGVPFSFWPIAGSGRTARRRSPRRPIPPLTTD